MNIRIAKKVWHRRFTHAYRFSTLLAAARRLGAEWHTERIIVIIGGYERHRDVPRGFWRLPRAARQPYLSQRWPGFKWAGDGVPGGQVNYGQ